LTKLVYNIILYTINQTMNKNSVERLA